DRSHSPKDVNRRGGLAYHIGIRGSADGKNIEGEPPHLSVRWNLRVGRIGINGQDACRPGSFRPLPVVRWRVTGTIDTRINVPGRRHPGGSTRRVPTVQGTPGSCSREI